jgi:DNA-binding transcriptional regulator GbsR (MarR family)
MSDLTEQFIMHFGEMGSRWGINRTVGQMYALLFVSPEPLCADEMVERLGISRSNVSMGLKELDSWQLLKRSSVHGDRREFFSTPGDVWEIFRRLAEQRHQREIAPTLSMLRTALLESDATPEDAHLRERMREMHDLIELLTGWFREVQKLDRGTLERLLKLGSGVVKLLEMKERITGGAPPPKQRIEPTLSSGPRTLREVTKHGN